MKKHRIALVAALLLIALAPRTAFAADVYAGAVTPKEALAANNAMLAEQSIDGVFLTAGMPQRDMDTLRSISFVRLDTAQYGATRPYNMALDYSHGGMVRHMARMANNGAVNVELYASTLQTSGGNNMYYIVLGQRKNPVTGTVNPNILCEAGCHARESGGPNILLKQLDDLLQAALHDETVRKALDHFYIAALVMANPDGYEAIGNGALPIDAKTNARRVNINQNYPSSNAGQKLHTPDDRSTQRRAPPASIGSPGPYLGSEVETKNAMAFVLKELNAQTRAVLSYHQVGRGIYGGKDFQTPRVLRASRDLRNLLMQHTGYKAIPEEPELVLTEPNGSFTDWVSDVAAGREYNAQYGRYGTPLLFTHGREDARAPGSGSAYNIAIITFEIGYNNSRDRHQRHAQQREYAAANFETVFPLLMRHYANIG